MTMKFSISRTFSWKIMGGGFLLDRVPGNSSPCVLFPGISEARELGQWLGLYSALPVHLLGSRELDATSQKALLPLDRSCKHTGHFWQGCNEMVMAGDLGGGVTRHLGFITQAVSSGSLELRFPFRGLVLSRSLGVAGTYSLLWGTTCLTVLFFCYSFLAIS